MARAYSAISTHYWLRLHLINSGTHCLSATRASSGHQMSERRGLIEMNLSILSRVMGGRSLCFPNAGEILPDRNYLLLLSDFC